MEKHEIEQLENYIYIEAALQNLEKTSMRIDELNNEKELIKKEVKKLKKIVYITICLSFILFLITIYGLLVWG